MPSRFEDIMKNLPVNAYTNRTGDLNIVKYLPQCFIHPDLVRNFFNSVRKNFFQKRHKKISIQASFYFESSLKCSIISPSMTKFHIF